MMVKFSLLAELAELADAHVSGACGRKPIRVQVPGSALGTNSRERISRLFC